MDDGVRIAEDVEIFLRAARAKEVDQCESMLKAKPELVNSVEAGGYSALHFAAFNGDIALIKVLLEYKPDVDSVNLDQNTPLVMAVKGRQLETIRVLVAAGADVNKTSPSGSTAAHHAASMAYMDCLRILADLGAQVMTAPSESGSLLHWACHSGDINCVGAMLYQYDIPVDTPDVHGGTALLTALFMKKTEVVEFLLEHGANPNVAIPEDGTTSLHIAVEHADNECVRLLISCGANGSARNNEGETALDVASRMKNSVAMKELSKPLVSKEKRAEDAVRFKNQGNKAFGLGENVKASKFYTLCIHLENTNHVYFSNRAAAYFNQKYYTGGYWDSMRCVKLNPTWVRGYVRKSSCELALKRYEDTIATATAGLKLEPGNKDLISVMAEAMKMK